MVRLFADECVAGSIIERLRSDRFDIVKAADVCPRADDDHGELVVRLGHPAHGVVNLALGDLAAATRARITSARLSELAIDRR
jgi:hypothetical protein